MRAFSLIELMLAIALLSFSVVGAFGAEMTLASGSTAATHEYAAIQASFDALQRVLTDPPLGGYEASTTKGSGYAIFSSRVAQDSEHISLQTIFAQWNNASGGSSSNEMEVHLPDPSIDHASCDPFVSGDWSSPIHGATYAITRTGFASSSDSGRTYTISDLSVAEPMLWVSVGSTTDKVGATLFAFSLSATTSPLLRASFDNASTSRTGFSHVVADGAYAYATNAFGSASAPTCADGISCAQLQVFKHDGTDVTRLSSLWLSTSTPPFARTSAGMTSPASSLSVTGGYAYLGLQKTAGGDEFDIIDIGDPSHLRWISGYRIGRTVNHILVRGTIAYVSTDDPTRELLLIDIANPYAPKLLGSYDAPGPSTFGYGVAVTVRPPFVRFGRSYSATAPELSLLDATNPHSITQIDYEDLGTAKDPQSVRAILTQDWLSFVLLTHSLTLWSTGSDTSMQALPYKYALPSGTTGASLACWNQYLYLARNTVYGSGLIDILHGS